MVVAATAQRDYYEVLAFRVTPMRRRSRTRSVCSPCAFTRTGVRSRTRRSALRRLPRRTRRCRTRPSASRTTSAGSGISTEDVFGGVDFEEIFGGVGFDVGGGLFDRLFQCRPAGPARGENIEVVLTVPLDRVAEGGPETVRFTRPTQCTSCGGSGARGGRVPAHASAAAVPAGS